MQAQAISHTVKLLASVNSLAGFWPVPKCRVSGNETFLQVQKPCFGYGLFGLRLCGVSQPQGQVTLSVHFICKNNCSSKTKEKENKPLKYVSSRILQRFIF